ADIYRDPKTWKSDKYTSNMRKAIMKNCAPTSLVGDSALAKEYIIKKTIYKHLCEVAWNEYDKKEQLLDFIMKSEKDGDKALNIAKKFVYLERLKLENEIM